MPNCKDCNFNDPDPAKWDGATSVYHDVKCPDCGTTRVDTSDWFAADPEYGYGSDNSLVMRETTQNA